MTHDAADTANSFVRALRNSGRAALAGMLLFGLVGAVLLARGDALGRPVPGTVTNAGQLLETQGFDHVIWGEGQHLEPAEVLCRYSSFREPTGETGGAAWVGERQEFTTRAGKTFVTLVDASELRVYDVVCEGGGLETFALGPSDDGLRGWKFGVFLLGFAGLSGLWALLMTTVTRRKAVPGPPSRKD